MQCTPYGPGGANTGGGGAARASDGYYFNKGGSGIVIIRHLVSYPAASFVSGDPMIFVANGYRVYKFLNSGSILFGNAPSAAPTVMPTGIFKLLQLHQKMLYRDTNILQMNQIRTNIASNKQLNQRLLRLQSLL